MEKNEGADISSILNHLCIALQPLAGTRNIKLNFTTTEKEIKLLILKQKYSGDL